MIVDIKKGPFGPDGIRHPPPDNRINAIKNHIFMNVKLVSSRATRDEPHLPRGWTWTCLRELGPLTDGDWILNSDYSASGVRLLQVGDIGFGGFVGKSSRFITRDRARELNCTILRPQDILISRMPDPIGRACLLPDLGYECITAVDVSIWRPDIRQADLNYLIFALTSHSWLQKVLGAAAGATRPRISRRNLEKLTIAIPPLAEQKRIAAVLAEHMTDVDKARAAAEAQLEAAKALPAAYLRQVFPKAGEEPPPGWRSVKLGEVCEFKHGGTPFKGNPSFWIGKIPWVSSKEMHPSIITDTEHHISDEAVRFSATSIVPKGTLLMVVRSGILLRRLPVAIVDRDMAFNQDIKAIVPDDRLDSKFLFFFFQANERRVLVDGIKRGSTVQSVKSGFIEHLEVPLPPLAEQKRIATILSEQMTYAERLRADLEKQLNEINALPAALLRRAFRGEL